MRCIVIITRGHEPLSDQLWVAQVSGSFLDTRHARYTIVLMFSHWRSSSRKISVRLLLCHIIEVESQCRSTYRLAHRSALLVLLASEVSKCNVGLLLHLKFVEGGQLHPCRFIRRRLLWVVVLVVVVTRGSEELLNFFSHEWLFVALSDKELLVVVELGLGQTWTVPLHNRVPQTPRIPRVVFQHDIRLSAALK